jgi:hypothetical protein
MTGDRLLNLSERWFRLLLRLYPADFRDGMGSRWWRPIVTARARR